MSAAALTASVPVSRYFDQAKQRWINKVLPGGSHISSDPREVLATVLGSCVAACLHDPVARIGGINHFMLPHDEAGDWNGASLTMRYGNHAMEALINALLKAGADRRRLECKFFGGGNVLRGGSNVGDRNAEFARTYAQTEGLRVTAADLGGDRGRRIIFDPVTGKAWRRFIRPAIEDQVVQVEERLRHAPTPPPCAGSVELF